MTEQNRKVKILGTTWEIIFRDKDISFKENYGYTNEISKQIVIQKISTIADSSSLAYNEDEHKLNQERVVRHEIIHAYLFECGLAESASQPDSWALNEEMVDWFARLGPKIYKTWEELNCI